MPGPCLLIGSRFSGVVAQCAGPAGEHHCGKRVSANDERRTDDCVGAGTDPTDHQMRISKRQPPCYGCHEHTPANIRAEHEEEGIRDFENCVECHRDPGVEPKKSGRSGDRDRGKAEKD